MIRRTEVLPAYDHVNGPPCARCIERGWRCKHGIGTEQWIFVVIEPHAAAAELRIATPFFLPVTPPDARQGARWYAANLGWHVAWPIDRAQVRDPEAALFDCGYLGQCYDGGSTGLGAEPFLKYVYTFEGSIDAQPEQLWKALEEHLARKIDDFKAASREDGHNRWVRCRHCEGAGTLDRRKL